MYYCNVCTDPITTEQDVHTCLFCQQQACVTCVQQYLTTQLYPNCMFCRKEWSLVYVWQTTYMEWFQSEYKKYRSRIFKEREKALLPQTTPAVEGLLIQEKYEELNKQLGTVKRILKTKAKVTKTGIYRKYTTQMLQQKKDELQQQINELQPQYHSARLTHFIQVGSNTPASSSTPKPTIVTKQCIRKGCKGWLNSKFICPVCETKVCYDCEEEIKGENNQVHVCNEDVKQTVALIRRDTKQCPSCSTYIFKISGCNQMFCTNCFTPFDWQTGSVILGRIHNPHYFDYLQNTNQQEQTRIQELQRHVGANTNCEQNILDDHLFLIRAARILPDTSVSRNIMYKLNYIFRLCVHIQDVEFRLFRIVRYDPNVNQDLRVKFILGRMTEFVFEQQIMKREKHREYTEEMYTLFEMIFQLMVPVLEYVRWSVNQDELPANAEQDIRLMILNVYHNVLHFNKVACDLAYKYNYKLQKYIDDSFDVIECAKWDKSFTRMYEKNMIPLNDEEELATKTEKMKISEFI